MKQYWFIASPYSKYPGGLDAAFRLAVRARGLLLQCGVPCFTPIVHSHPVAFECGLDPRDLNIWLPAEEPLRKNAYGLIVLCGESWEDSEGTKLEIQEFKDLNKPVRYMQPNKITLELLTSLQFQEPETVGYVESVGIVAPPMTPEQIDEIMRQWQMIPRNQVEPIVHWDDLKVADGAIAAMAELEKLVDTVMEDIKPAVATAKVPAPEPEPEQVPPDLQAKLFNQSVADIGECLVTLSDILQQGIRVDNAGRRGGIACGLERAAAHVRGQRYIPVVDPKHLKNKTGN